jgi:hypothetical protein
MVISDIYQQKVSLIFWGLAAEKGDTPRVAFQHRIITIHFNVLQPNRGSILQ